MYEHEGNIDPPQNLTSTLHSEATEPQRAEELLYGVTFLGPVSWLLAHWRAWVFAHFLSVSAPQEEASYA